MRTPVSMTGRVAMPSFTVATTGLHHPQPPSQENDSRGSLEDAELGRGRTFTKARMPSVQMPSSQKARKMAAATKTKMASGSKLASKGASKMASAMGKRFRFAATSGQHQAIANESESAAIIGREAGPDISAASDPEATPCGDGEVSWDCGEDTSALLDHSQDHAQYSPQSTPSTENPRSPECLDRSQSEADSDRHSEHTAGSDSDATGRAKSHFVQPPKKREPESWDAKTFSNHTRPLECSSIWQIPTSRVPRPEPAPVDPVVRVSTETFSGAARCPPKVSVRLPPPETMQSTSGGAVLGRAKNAGRSSAVICLSVTLVAGAAVAAMVFMSSGR